MINQKDIDLIDLYLNNKLKGASLDSFNNRVKNDPEFAAEVEMMQKISGGIKDYCREQLRSKLKTLAAKQGNKKQISKRILYWSIAASLLVLIGLSGVYYALFLKPAPTDFAFNKVAPPFHQADIKYNEYKVDANQGAVFSYSSGTIITVPKNAFINKKGEVVTGNINVKYREMSSPEDIFLAGIPMSYDSSGHLLNMQTAGVCELQAFKDDSVININPLSTINIDFSSTFDKTGYSLLSFDTVSKKWQKKGHDSSLVNLADYAAMPSGELIPRKADHSLKHFKIVFRNPAKFPEFAQYKNYTFEVPLTEKSYRGDEMGTNWASTSIIKTNQNGEYQITLINPGRQVTFNAYPVFYESDYQIALNTYNQKIKSELAKLYGADTTKYKEANRIKGLQKKLVINDSANISTASVYRSFRVGKTGLWCYSRVNNKPLGANLNMDFRDANGKALDLKYVAILDKSNNTVMRYSPADLKSIRFDNLSQNMMVAITTDDNFAYLKKEDFAKLPVSGSCTVKMQVAARKPESSKDITDLI